MIQEIWQCVKQTAVIKKRRLKKEKEDPLYTLYPPPGQKREKH